MFASLDAKIISALGKVTPAILFVDDGFRPENHHQTGKTCYNISNCILVEKKDISMYSELYYTCGIDIFISKLMCDIVLKYIM